MVKTYYANLVESQNKPLDQSLMSTINTESWMYVTHWNSTSYIIQHSVWLAITNLLTSVLPVIYIKIGKVFRISTVRYNWPMSAHTSQAFSIAHCSDLEDLPKTSTSTKYYTIYCTLVVAIYWLLLFTFTN